MIEKLEIWDPHFHIWDVRDETESGHQLEQLLLVDDDPIYSTPSYEAQFAPAADVFVHLGGAWVEAVSVCHVGLTGPKYTDYCLAEARWAAQQLSRSDRDYVLIPTAPLEAPDAAEALAALTAIPGVHGIRQIVNHEPSWPRNEALGDLLDNPQWQKGYAELQKHEMSFDLQLNASQFEKAARLIAHYPDVPVIINHLGSPTMADITENRQQYRDGMAALAGCDHTYIKISMLFYTAADWDQCGELIETVHWIIDTFGIDRCFFASNYPVDVAKGWPADRLYGAFRNLAARYGLDGQRKLFSENARRAYRADLRQSRSDDHPTQ